MNSSSASRIWPILNWRLVGIMMLTGALGVPVSEPLDPPTWDPGMSQLEGSRYCGSKGGPDMLI